MIKRILGICIIILITAVYCSAGPYEDGTVAANTSGNRVLSEIGSPDQINNRLANPLTSDGAGLSTFGPVTVPPVSPGICPDGYNYDGSVPVCRKQSFNAQIRGAPSSENFLEVTIGAGPTHDLTSLVIQQDLDFDGVFDATYISPWIASGVCANGIISCNAGTWDNCSYFTWTANISEISLTSVPQISNLAGCYCINTSCGSDLVPTNMEQILKDLGAGIMGTLQDTDPHLTVTKVENTAPFIKFYGQRSSSAGSSYSSEGLFLYYGGTTTPEHYYNPTGSPLVGDGANEASVQAADKNSLYSLLLGTRDQIVDTQEIRSCVKTRNITIDDSDTPQLNTMDTCTVLDITDCSIYKETICDYKNKDCVDTIENFDPTGYMLFNSQVYMTSPVTGDPWGFSATGISILYSYQADLGTLSSGLDHWWCIKREYLCDTEYDINTFDYPLVEPTSSYMAKEGLERADHTSQSVAEMGDTIVYEDYNPNTGSSLSRSFDLQPRDPTAPCEKVCKVQTPITSTDVGTEGKTSDYQHDVNSIETIYKPCNSTGSCDVESGETLLQDCTCTNSFPEAASAMMMLEKASNDMICSGD